jgi:hypothetical protein
MAQPLVDRLGVAFFRAVPRAPGVYFLRDADSRVLYIGKAKDLRQRLASYRCLTGASRKTVRLVHQVRHIDWEICRSDAEASLREGELIRTHRPRFNRVGVWPRADRYIRLQALSRGLRIQTAHESDASQRPLLAAAQAAPLLFEAAQTMMDSETSSPALAWLYGAFKPGVSWAVGALLRRLWLTSGYEFSALPRPLSSALGPREFELPSPNVVSWLPLLHAYFVGESDELVARLAGESTPARSRFEEQLREADLDCLREFYLRGPSRNRDSSRPEARSFAVEQLSPRR